ncbi:unnamed protein product [Candidula unifasciata]|uniref:MICOS complex subunit MIC13 n=1 Tax=Candidula unifasciata TaxID=100452 RepID=A0A8S4A1U9_9EUPU|nr:unnamed protein product [Candidula unifasciata]
MALGFAKYAATISLAGGAIYWSVQQGIWGSTKEGSEAGKKLTKTIAPATSEYVEKIPSVKDVKTFVRTNWNTGVKTLFTAASQLPEVAGEYKEKAKAALADKSGN